MSIRCDTVNSIENQAAQEMDTLTEDSYERLHNLISFPVDRSGEYTRKSDIANEKKRYLYHKKLFNEVFSYMAENPGFVDNFELSLFQLFYEGIHANGLNYTSLSTVRTIYNFTHKQIQKFKRLDRPIMKIFNKIMPANHYIPPQYYAIFKDKTGTVARIVLDSFNTLYNVYQDSTKFTTPINLMFDDFSKLVENIVSSSNTEVTFGDMSAAMIKDKNGRIVLDEAAAKQLSKTNAIEFLIWLGKDRIKYIKPMDKLIDEDKEDFYNALKRVKMEYVNDKGKINTVVGTLIGDNIRNVRENAKGEDIVKVKTSRGYIVAIQRANMLSIKGAQNTVKLNNNEYILVRQYGDEGRFWYHAYKVSDVIGKSKESKEEGKIEEKPKESKELKEGFYKAGKWEISEETFINRGIPSEKRMGRWVDHAYMENIDYKLDDMKSDMAEFFNGIGLSPGIWSTLKSVKNLVSGKLHKDMAVLKTSNGYVIKVYGENLKEIKGGIEYTDRNGVVQKKKGKVLKIVKDLYIGDNVFDDIRKKSAEQNKKLEVALKRAIDHLRKKGAPEEYIKKLIDDMSTLGEVDDYSGLIFNVRTVSNNIITPNTYFGKATNYLPDKYYTQVYLWEVNRSIEESDKKVGEYEEEIDDLKEDYNSAEDEADRLEIAEEIEYKTDMMNEKKKELEHLKMVFNRATGQETEINDELVLQSKQKHFKSKSNLMDRTKARTDAAMISNYITDMYRIYHINRLKIAFLESVPYMDDVARDYTRYQINQTIGHPDVRAGFGPIDYSDKNVADKINLLRRVFKSFNAKKEVTARDVQAFGSSVGRYQTQSLITTGTAIQNIGQVVSKMVEFGMNDTVFAFQNMDKEEYLGKNKRNLLNSGVLNEETILLDAIFAGVDPHWFTGKWQVFGSWISAKMHLRDSKIDTSKNEIDKWIARSLDIERVSKQSIYEAKKKILEFIDTKKNPDESDSEYLSRLKTILKESKMALSSHYINKLTNFKLKMFIGSDPNVGINKYTTMVGVENMLRTMNFIIACKFCEDTGFIESGKNNPKPDRYLDPMVVRTARMFTWISDFIMSPHAAPEALRGAIGRSILFKFKQYTVSQAWREIGLMMQFANSAEGKNILSKTAYLTGSLAKEVYISTKDIMSWFTRMVKITGVASGSIVDESTGKRVGQRYAVSDNPQARKFLRFLMTRGMITAITEGMAIMPLIHPIVSMWNMGNVAADAIVGRSFGRIGSRSFRRGSTSVTIGMALKAMRLMFAITIGSGAMPGGKRRKELEESLFGWLYDVAPIPATSMVHLFFASLYLFHDWKASMSHLRLAFRPITGV